MHTHYVALVTANDDDEATRATLALMDSYGPNTGRDLYDYFGIGGRWNSRLKHVPDAPDGDYSTLADYADRDVLEKPCGANLIRARSLRSPEYSAVELAADEERARAVAAATRGLDLPPFPGLDSDPDFAGKFIATRDSDWMKAAQGAWREVADGADSHLDWSLAPYLIEPGIYARYRDSFAHKNSVYGFIIETPTVFTHAPEGLLFNDDATAVYLPDKYVCDPERGLETQEQMMRNLEPETTWIVSLDLHD